MDASHWQSPVSCEARKHFELISFIPCSRIVRDAIAYNAQYVPNEWGLCGDERRFSRVEVGGEGVQKVVECHTKDANYQNTEKIHRTLGGSRTRLDREHDMKWKHCVYAYTRGMSIHAPDYLLTPPLELSSPVYY